ncbi:MAG TPA: type II toxin-antitoxin system RatA family toxin [Spongiibacteraceae bacterium]|jgi:ribosome-associated toxin RatA of RatAB toxin-antitoxin module|nr:type II toxin-antitoxin system RatA family toxin [Spongiibacteraceae bacterium]HUH36810.1 type II toxin-antitoxin system RatA family toxin [Spongiibacteraceae bacterium]
MAVIERSVLLPHSAQQMFTLVNDVRRYPEFLPGCAATEVMAESETEMVARLVLSKAGLRYAFTTRNALVPGASIRLALVEGPFRRLQGEWSFTPLSGGASKVALRLEFEMAGALLNRAASKLFSEVADGMVDAMVKRARQVYGTE